MPVGQPVGDAAHAARAFLGVTGACRPPMSVATWPGCRIATRTRPSSSSARVRAAMLSAAFELL